MSSSGTSRDVVNPKLDWIKTVTASPLGNSEQIAESAQRLMQLAEARGGSFRVYIAESRFVTGLGLSHPVENGFAWHPTLGTPYLPGSSVKGMVRAWASLDADPPPELRVLQHLLGDDRQAGNVALLDAVPIEPVQLEADVMTPHYAGWTPEDPPGDWMSPTPIPFLTAAPGSSFLFSIIPRRPTVTDEDLTRVWEWLTDAFDWAGGGAKTAVGYGRFYYSIEKTSKLREQRAEQIRIAREEQDRAAQQQREAREREELMTTPVGRWMVQLQDLREPAVVDQVRVNLEATPLDDSDDRRAFANAVTTLYGEWVELWRAGRKNDPTTSSGGRRLRQLARLVDAATEESNPPGTT